MSRPDNTDDLEGIRDKQGRFIKGVSGNPNGKPAGSISLTAAIKKRISDSPKDCESTYMVLIVEQMLQKARYGDTQMIKMIWEHIDGRPRESVDMQGNVQFTNLIDLLKNANEND